MLTFDLGGGPAVLESNVDVKAGVWYKIEAERNHAQGSLAIDGGVAVKGTAIFIVSLSITQYKVCTDSE